MKIYHTSPNPISEIKSDGMLGSCLCFSDEVYVMTARDYVTYSIDIDESEIWTGWDVAQSDDDTVIAARQQLAAELAALAGCDEDTADDYICDIQQMPFSEDVNVQTFQARLAEMCELPAFKTRDEQGTLYIVPMTNEKLSQQI